MNVIERSAIPTKIPVGTNIITWLLFDRIGISDTQWGIYWTVMTLLYLAAIMMILFENHKTPKFEDD